MFPDIKGLNQSVDTLHRDIQMFKKVVEQQIKTNKDLTAALDRLTRELQKSNNGR